MSDLFGGNMVRHMRAHALARRAVELLADKAWDHFREQFGDCVSEPVEREGGEVPNGWEVDCGYARLADFRWNPPPFLTGLLEAGDEYAATLWFDEMLKERPALAQKLNVPAGGEARLALFHDIMGNDFKDELSQEAMNFLDGYWDEDQDYVEIMAEAGFDYRNEHLRIDIRANYGGRVATASRYLDPETLTLQAVEDACEEMFKAFLNDA